MGLDGFSMANLGLHKEFTSAQLANNAEKLAKKGTELSIKNIEGLVNKQKITRKDHDDEDRYEPAYDDEDDDDSNENNETEDEDDKNQGSKRYNVKLNKNSQLIELIDTENNQIIETISPTDLIKLVSKLNSTSGILINRKI